MIAASTSLGFLALSPPPPAFPRWAMLQADRRQGSPEQRGRSRKRGRCDVAAAVEVELDEAPACLAILQAVCCTVRSGSASCPGVSRTSVKLRHVLAMGTMRIMTDQMRLQPRIARQLVRSDSPATRHCGVTLRCRVITMLRPCDLRRAFGSSRSAYAVDFPDGSSLPDIRIRLRKRSEVPPAEATPPAAPDLAHPGAGPNAS